MWRGQPCWEGQGSPHALNQFVLPPTCCGTSHQPAPIPPAAPACPLPRCDLPRSYCPSDNAPFSKASVPGCCLWYNGTFYDNIAIRRRGVTSLKCVALCVRVCLWGGARLLGRGGRA